ncbi:hypothetical protein GCK32_002575 [Trichostrongylus colubriformis]|uniref:Uncharacterized protein n=1 Tax=Trichostrongylus colubriformis TaxID=6319 RepID=A0AAN8EQM5_TRICO
MNGFVVKHTYFDDDKELCEINETDTRSTVLVDISTAHLSHRNELEPKPANLKQSRKRKRLSSNTNNCGNLVETPGVSSFPKKAKFRKRKKQRKSRSGTGKSKKKGDGERGSFVDAISKDLVADVKRDIVNQLLSTPYLLKLSLIDASWHQLCADYVKRLKRNGGVVDIGLFFRDKNPFLRKFVEENGQIIAKTFHDDVRFLVRKLHYLMEPIWRSGDEESCLMLDDFTPKALGYHCSYSEEQLPSCPVVLREKIRDLFMRDFPRTSRYVYSPSFLEPRTFLDLVACRRDIMTSLNLGELKVHGQPLMRLNFPKLRELIWHNADMFELASWNTTELAVLSVTASASSMSGFETVTRLPNLEHLYTGLKVPDDPTRFDLDVLLRSYQAFWNNPVLARQRGEERGEGNGPDFVVSALPNLQRIAFWNAPEKIFSLMATNNISFETVQFGQLNQSLTRLCSLDSIMQALFKFNQPKYECFKLNISHLKLYLHAMPVVSLDYYLPQLMMGVNDAMVSLRSLDIFVHCSFSATMPTSWMLEGRQKNSSSKLKNLTHFSLHIDGFCVFNDLDCHLPPSLICVSISVSLPANGARRSVSSLMEFIKRLSNVNSYPDLEEIHLQVWGVRCAEQLLNHVADHLSDVRRLSVIAMPVSEQRGRLVDLIRHVTASCSRLVSLQLSVEMMLILVKEYGDLWTHNWRLAIARAAAECGMRDSCDFGVGALPRVSECDEYTVKPSFPEDADVELNLVDFADDEDELSRKDSAQDSDGCSNDSFVVESDEEVSEEDDDEIDLLDKELESETDRRHERYERKKSRIPSTSSEESLQDDEDEDGSDVEYITDYEDDENEPYNPLIDDKAEEVDSDEESDEGSGTEPDDGDSIHSSDEGMLDSEAEVVESGMESVDGSDTEPEGEDAVFSSDQEMLEAAAEMVNARPRRDQGKAVRRKRIIVSSDSD